MRVEGAVINLNVRLAMNGSNYNLWRGLMLEVIHQYDVDTWISPDFTDHSSNAAWNIVSKAVKRWFLVTMVTKLASFILDWDVSNDQTWSSIETHFINNHRTRRFQLTTELYAIRQEDSPVPSFYACLKDVDDILCDTGNVLDDDEVVIRLLHGVNKDHHETTVKIIEKSHLLLFPLMSL
ncbi:hypothetical protein D1007_28379 [Hordeum vulgare]|nr:hypothetical protein D1007_28379 [Hordeum vulgare]